MGCGSPRDKRTGNNKIKTNKIQKIIQESKSHQSPWSQPDKMADRSFIAEPKCSSNDLFRECDQSVIALQVPWHFSLSQSILTLCVLSILTSIFFRVSWSSRSMMISEPPPSRKFILKRTEKEKERKRKSRWDLFEKKKRKKKKKKKKLREWAFWIKKMIVIQWMRSVNHLCEDWVWREGGQKSEKFSKIYLFFTLQWTRISLVETYYTYRVGFEASKSRLLGPCGFHRTGGFHCTKRKDWKRFPCCFLLQRWLAF